MRNPWGRFFILVLMTLVCGSSPAKSQQTYLLGIHQGSGLTAAAEALGNGGYELANGTWQPFRQWYHSDWGDLSFDMLTELSDHFGVLWGASTGESAEKIRINPSLKLGMIIQDQPTPTTTLSLTASTTLWGDMTELPCTADYGAIGGMQIVNCRLAASPLPPADTLKYLAHADPSRLKLSLSFRGQF